MKDLKNKIIVPIFDILTIPLTLLASLWVKFIRRRLLVLPLAERIFMRVEMLPILNHYYQPLINPKKYLNKLSRLNRNLPAINFNETEQLKLLSEFNYNHELLSFPYEKSEKREYYYNNSPFGPGDAEYLYNMVRYFKPAKIIEIGCGNSTLMIRNAIKNNIKENLNYKCDHTCIEPYEAGWLEELDINIVRKKAEDVELSLFSLLEKNDVLFIDSSHMIRPQGDVLFECLQLLPTLKQGVLIHIHDIFTPNDYPEQWLNEHRLWNEQYLVEGFLCFNSEFKILGALNYLYNHHTNKFLEKCPVLAKEKNREPASFWMTRK